MFLRKRWYFSRKLLIIATITTVIYVVYNLVFLNKFEIGLDMDTVKREIENKLEKALIYSKGGGCVMPKLDPFAEEVTQFDKELPKIVCRLQDWVKCYFSECRVTKEILRTTKDIVCTYRDIIYESDKKYHIGAPTEVLGDNVYTLAESDHVKIKCTGKHIDSVVPSTWTGYGVGFRNTVKPKQPPLGREESVNVLILGFDSTSRNGFIRRMPKSYKVLTEELQATVLSSYNIVGDGTPAALFPILTGMNEWELPDVRRRPANNSTLDSVPFIFYQLKEDGYRTGFFEDMPRIGTFQYRLNGFRHQPADHYMYPFHVEESHNGAKWKDVEKRYCVGGTPQYKLTLNLTEQFLKLDGKRFIFTFIVDLSHEDFNIIATADDDLADFLMMFQRSGFRKDTMLVLMGDHGPRYSQVRNTLQGKLEERLPLMAIVLPYSLLALRPQVASNLNANAHALTTPYDVHTTLLDAVGLLHLQNTYIVPGADYTRGMTLFELLPHNRSCSEAGVEAHWCACVRWQHLDASDAAYMRAVEAFITHLNHLTDPVRVEWVLRQQVNQPLLQFAGASDPDGYLGRFMADTTNYDDHYQVKVEVGPGRGMYEATVTYSNKKDEFHVDSKDISRTNEYGSEPECISATHPDLNKYCYCKDATTHGTQ